MKAISIKTETGNQILKTLVKANGWRIQAQYDENAFDKGIDFNSYSLEKEGIELYFEWTNWLEWEISGDPEIIQKLSQDFGFELKAEG